MKLDGVNRVVSRDAGVALLTALALLFFFSVLGASFVRSISIDLERTETELAGQRAAAFARGGVEAAIGWLAADLASGKAPSVLPKDVEISYPVYRADKSSPTGIGPDETLRGKAIYSVTDESGKLNINQATPRVLKSVLGIDGNAARKIRGSLPLPAAMGQQATRSWLTNLSELTTRGLVKPEEYAKIDPNLVTVHSVVDNAAAEGFLNVNAAPPQVLAALLEIPMPLAEELAKRNDFENLQQLCEAAGKDPSTFNGGPGATGEAADKLARDLAFQSRCFRIKCEGVVSEVGPGGAEYRPVRRRVEAVVVFDRVADPQVTYWSESAESAGAA